MRLDHVQVSCPPGGEEIARAFYRDALGMTEVEKPPLLQARGGCWFREGAAEVHIGVEQDFRPAKKAHPALAVDDLDAVAGKLEKLGYPVSMGQRDDPGPPAIPHRRRPREQGRNRLSYSVAKAPAGATLAARRAGRTEASSPATAATAAMTTSRLTGTAYSTLPSIVWPPIKALVPVHP